MTQHVISNFFNKDISRCFLWASACLSSYFLRPEALTLSFLASCVQYRFDPPLPLSFFILSLMPPDLVVNQWRRTDHEWTQDWTLYGRRGKSAGLSFVEVLLLLLLLLKIIVTTVAATAVWKRRRRWPSASEAPGRRTECLGWTQNGWFIQKCSSRIVLSQLLLSPPITPLFPKRRPSPYRNR